MSEFNDINFPEGKDRFFRRDNIILVFSILVVLTTAICCLVIFWYYNKFQNSGVIQDNVYIKGIEVSGLSKQDAVSKVEAELKEKMEEHIILKYNNYEYYLELEQIDAHFDINSAVEYAYNNGRKGQILQDYKEYFNVKFNGINIEPVLKYDKDALKAFLDQIQEELPDQLEQTDYYLDNDDLIITSGHFGAVIYKDKISKAMIDEITNLSYANCTYEIPTYNVYPDEIDVQAIHDEVYQEMQNASFTKDPYMIYADKRGVDFNVQNVIDKINQNPNQEEYKFALDITKPEVTIDDIGIEAFPNLLATYSTKYVNNANRTTNLKLAASKINSKVVMPNEIFSFNKVVGKRTASAGYKNAAIFVNGSVEDGLAGGICQISTTLYNAVNLAGLEVTERRNHSLLASYAQPGRDATVVWGSSDLKFQNTRNYPVKIYFSVEGGYAKCSVYGLKTEEDCDISLETVTIKKTSTSLVVDTYRVYKKDGKVIKKEKLHRDTYKV